jgi:polyisoprenoid-binding protein YceI
MVLGALFFTTTASNAIATLHAPTSAAVSFRAKTTVFMMVEGRGQQLSVSDDGRTVLVRVPLKSISTGMDLRDRHMREALDIAHYPDAELKVLRNALVLPARGGSKSATVSAQLTLHGQTRPIALTYQAQEASSTYQVEGTLGVDMTEFGIRPASYAGIAVKPQVVVRASFSVKD